MQKLNKQTIKLITAFLPLLIASAIFATSSVAWYSKNMQVSAHGLNMFPVSGNLSIDYRIYRYDQDLGVGEDVTEELTELSLPQYDSIITERNVNTNLIIKVTVSTDSSDIDLTKLKCNISRYTTTAEKVLTDITYFKVAQLDDSTWANDPDKIFKGATAAFNATKTEEDVTTEVHPRETFVDAPNKKMSLTFDLNGYTLTSHKLIFYIMYDYDPDLIADKVEFSMSSITGEVGGSETMSNEWAYVSDLDTFEVYEDDSSSSTPAA